MKKNMSGESMEPPDTQEFPPAMGPPIQIDFNRPYPAINVGGYWQAESFASRIQREFIENAQRGNTAGMRSRFYALVDYYERIMLLLRDAITQGKSPLIVSSLRSMIALNAPLQEMHKTAPNSIPFPLTLDTRLRHSLIKDLIILSLQDANRSLSLRQITDYVNQHGFVQEFATKAIEKYIQELIETGHMTKSENNYTITDRIYKASNIDDTSLQALLGPELYSEFAKAGFPGLSNIVNRRSAFHEFFEDLSSSGEFLADIFIAAVLEILNHEESKARLNIWHHSDVISSEFPRPYQRVAYTLFRGYGYQGQLIEAPTGSGKTLIGMMVIQNWLSLMSSGESILVLVPTINYEQQWVRELCYKRIGLHLSPDDVFSGTPTAYEDERKKLSHTAPILVMTYTSLGQLGSPKGKGGFDQISIEKFLQGGNIRYVILDEVHKVAEDLESGSAGVTGLLVDWLRDGSIEGLIGFTGTATAYRQRFQELGLQLVYNMPSADLIAYGFVAPFAEFGLPFTYSDREREILSLLELYKSSLREFIDIIGPANLRSLFKQVPLAERMRIGSNILGMYHGKKNKDKALENRLRQWEEGEAINFSELPLISIIQIVNGLSDTDIVQQAIVGLPAKERREKLSRFTSMLAFLNKLRAKLAQLVFSANIARYLEAPSFGRRIDKKHLLGLAESDMTKMDIREESRYLLSSTITGLYTSLTSLYYRMGEGRVETINSIIRAEANTRKLNATIIFSYGKRIRWQTGIASPGYVGVAGVFSEMLGQRGIVPMAVLSNELYLPWHDKNPIPQQIADFIRKDIMTLELSDILFSLLTQGLDLSDETISALRKRFDTIVKKYIRNLSAIGAVRRKEFQREVLTPLRKSVNRLKLGDVSHKLRVRLSMKNRHLQKWMKDFYNYGIIASKFQRAKIAELIQSSGRERRFFVIRMSQGERKQLMYDLAARIVDAEKLPINAIIVSSWARTGWNVIKPNLLIDSTATRNITAWQQLRGRAMRAMQTWNNSCYEAMMQLLGPKMGELTASANNDAAEKDKSNAIFEYKELGDSTRELLLKVHNESNNLLAAERAAALSEKILKKPLSDFADDERAHLAIELMMSRNKVTHIYELVKAYGSSMQITQNRRNRKWNRIAAISVKHSSEYSVNPFTGEYGTGEAHAPLVYYEDPREYSHSDLGKHLQTCLEGCDRKIIRGWFDAVISEKRG
jgi:superfamily II DNA or RNA helicase/predicted transcriptional regulator